MRRDLTLLAPVADIAANPPRATLIRWIGTMSAGAPSRPRLPRFLRLLAELCQRCIQPGGQGRLPGDQIPPGQLQALAPTFDRQGQAFWRQRYRIEVPIDGQLPLKSLIEWCCHGDTMARLKRARSLCAQMLGSGARAREAAASGRTAAVASSSTLSSTARYSTYLRRPIAVIRQIVWGRRCL